MYWQTNYKSYIFIVSIVSPVIKAISSETWNYSVGLATNLCKPYTIARKSKYKKEWIRGLYARDNQHLSHRADDAHMVWNWVSLRNSQRSLILGMRHSWKFVIYTNQLKSVLGKGVVCQCTDIYWYWNTEETEVSMTLNNHSKIDVLFIMSGGLRFNRSWCTFTKNMYSELHCSRSL